MDPLFGIDDVRLCEELQHMALHATVPESMLIALNHMQVSVITLRGRGGAYTGMTGFRKNVISFPQDVSQLRNYQHFLANLAVNDVVNIRRRDMPEGPRKLAAARILNFEMEGIRVEMQGLQGHIEERVVPLTDIEQRMKLPWKPSALGDHFVVFRRRNMKKEEYVDDLRVRRDSVIRILQLLSERRYWRPACDFEPMHRYYTAFDWLDRCEIEECLPENDVPAGLHFKDLEEEPEKKGMTREGFCNFLQEGHFDCPIAIAVLHCWVHGANKAHGNSSLTDFFDSMLSEFLHNPEYNTNVEMKNIAEHDQMPIVWLADYVQKFCMGSWQHEDSSIDEQRAEIVRGISTEAASVSFYLSTWITSGALHGKDVVNVERRMKEQASRIVLPWPEILEDPVAERSDGRFVKSFPVQFPAGVGDLHQERIRADIKASEWCQHMFRYFDGRILSSNSGQRAAWAIFNTALRSFAYDQGGLVHRRADNEVLTKAQLKEFVLNRNDLLRDLCSFGADIPTSSMQWKKEGNRLEWIVRQMSVTFPWIRTDEPTELLTPKRRRKPP